MEATGREQASTPAPTLPAGRPAGLSRACSAPARTPHGHPRLSQELAKPFQSKVAEEGPAPGPADAAGSAGSLGLIRTK